MSEHWCDMLSQNLHTATMYISLACILKQIQNRHHKANLALVNYGDIYIYVYKIITFKVLNLFQGKGNDILTNNSKGKFRLWGKWWVHALHA